MALTPIFANSYNQISHFPVIICSHSPISSNSTRNRSNLSRRLGLGFIASSVSAMPIAVANGINLKFITPDQTLEEAERGIRGHADALLEVKDFIETDSWKEAQMIIRSNSPLLKQDIRTVIQYKAAAERPILRKLYSFLFNNVTQLDYAARDKDGERVRQCYNNIVMAISDILSRV